MVYLMAAVALLLVVGGIILLVTGEDRYAQMSEKGFEAEAQRGSALGSAILEIQKMVDPRNRVEYLQQRDKRVGADSAEAGDGPARARPGAPTERAQALRLYDA